MIFLEYPSGKPQIRHQYTATFYFPFHIRAEFKLDPFSLYLSIQVGILWDKKHGCI